MHPLYDLNPIVRNKLVALFHSVIYCPAMERLPKWELISGRLNDGAESLVLKKDGVTHCEYAPGIRPYHELWTVYYNGFPKKEFLTRESCIRDAERVANQPLSIKIFEEYKK